MIMWPIRYDRFCDRLMDALCPFVFLCFFFNDTATTEIYTLSLHDALPILQGPCVRSFDERDDVWQAPTRSEEHTSELQSRLHLVCRLLLEKKKKNNKIVILNLTNNNQRQPESHTRKS